MPVAGLLVENSIEVRYPDEPLAIGLDQAHVAGHLHLATKARIEIERHAGIALKGPLQARLAYDMGVDHSRSLLLCQQREQVGPVDAGMDIGRSWHGECLPL